MKLKCEECSNITSLNNEEAEIEVISFIGGGSFNIAKSNKQYYCEYCGNRLSLN